MMVASTEQAAPAFRAEEGETGDKGALAAGPQVGTEVVLGHW